jgi:hypothetical protein
MAHSDAVVLILPPWRRSREGRIPGFRRDRIGAWTSGGLRIAGGMQDGAGVEPQLDGEAAELGPGHGVVVRRRSPGVDDGFSFGLAGHFGTST